MTRRFPIFPLRGVLVFPGLQLPLHIFEPRYRAMLAHALAGDRLVGMVQPRAPASRVDDSQADVFVTGCLGRIVETQALDDGRSNIVLSGLARFRIRHELPGERLFRMVEAEVEAEDRDEGTLAAIERAALEREARRFARVQGYLVDWEAVAGLDDRTLVNGIAQVAPFDGAAKQALLEADTLGERSELAIQLMRFFARRDRDDTHVTLQ